MSSRAVVVRADHTDQMTIEALLTRLRAQRPAGADEIVIVDSSPVSQPLAIRACEDVRICRLPRERFSYGRALNVGAAETSSDILVFLNGHTIPIGTSWLQDLTAPLEDETVGGACGLQNGEWPNRRVLELSVLNRENFGPPSWRGLSTCNLATRREIWERFPFDEDAPFGEDKEWGHRVVAAGYEIRLGVEATIHHVHPERSPDRRRAFQAARCETEYAWVGVPDSREDFADLLKAAAAAPWRALRATFGRVLVDLARFRGRRQGRARRSGAKPFERRQA